MSHRTETLDAAAAGTVSLGDELTVNRMGFGAMRLTGEAIWGPPEDREEAKRVLRRAVELGVDFIDTADSYGPEVSEELIAETLHPYSDHLVVATKGGLLRGGPGEWRPDCRPEHLRQACEASLRRLRLERIDLYQLHTVDPEVPYEESMGALVELQREGKIRLIGVSNVDRQQLATARRIADVVSVQNRYNLLHRDSEAVVDLCEREGLAFIPWYPLAAGELVGDGSPLAAAAERRGATSAQLALAWLLRRGRTMLPIAGTSSVEHLEENVAAAGIELSHEEFGELSAQVDRKR